MACFQEERRRLIGEAIDLLQEKNQGNTVTFNKENGEVVITPHSSSQVKYISNAVEYGKRMQKQLETAFGEDYNFNTFGNWGTLITGKDNVKLKIDLPYNLQQSMKRFEEEKGYNEAVSDLLLEERLMKEQVYAEYAEDLPLQSQDKLDFSALIEYKKLMQERIEDISQTLRAMYSQDKTAETKLRLNEINKIKQNIESDLTSLMNKDTIFEDSLEFIERDLDTIDTLLDNSNITNLQTAEKMISFYSKIADYSYDNRSSNPFIDLENEYDEKGNLLLEKDITDVLDNLAAKIQSKRDRLDAAKESYLKDVVDSSNHIQKLFPGIDYKDLLTPAEDIDKASKYLLTIDKQFGGQDSLLSQLIRIELEQSRSKNKSYVGELIGKLNPVADAAAKKLPKVKGFFTGMFSETDWSVFYQSNISGNKTGRIVDKFSENWYRESKESMKLFNDKIRELSGKGKWEDVNKTLKRKYKWLNDNADFFDPTQIPEIINNPEFSQFNGYFVHDSSADYSQYLKDELGEFMYEKLLAKQTEQIREYMDWKTQYVQSILLNNNADTVDELPGAVKFNMQVTIMRTSPFEFIQSREMGRGSEIFLNADTSYPSHIKYIEHFPRKTVERFNSKSNQFETGDSGYYDDNFKQIEQDKDLLDFYKVLDEITHYINMTLADAETMIKHGSVLSMKKSFTEILIDPESGIGAKAILLSSNLKQWLSSQFTSNNTEDKNADDFEKINKAQFQTNEREVNLRSKTMMLKLNRIAGFDLSRMKAKDPIPNAVVGELLKLSGYKTELEMTKGSPYFNIEPFVKEQITNQVINEQTFNLPVLLRAYSEMAAEYQSQKESLPQITIYKEYYNNIKRETTNPNIDTSNKVMNANNALINAKKLSSHRINAIERMNYWFNKNVLGNRDNSPWLDLGKRDLWLVSSFNKIEKELKKELEELRKDNTLTEKQRNEIENDLRQLGSNFVLSAIYEALVNKSQIFIGLGYNIKSNIINRFQGWFQAMAYDNGQFATEGNFQVANGFTSRRVARFIHRIAGKTSYAKQIDIAKLLINQLNIIQDATNELDRARNTSGLVGIAKKLSPFYLTEYTEWNNQAPQILSILMDKEITDKEGNSKKIFDGRTFPAYDIIDGKLQLKPEFDTPENRNEWLSFNTPSASDTKNYISAVIALINGDYSKTGSIVAKKTSLGRTAMTFKTWMPNAVYNRIAGITDIDGQTNLMLGTKDFKGIYTSHRPATGLYTGAVSGLLVAGLPGALIGGGIGAIAGGWVSKKQNGSMGLDLSIASEVATVGKAVIQKMIGMPVNFVSGRDIVKNHQLGNMAVTPEDLQRLKSIIAELSVLLTMVLFKLVVKSLLGPNDEKEPKTITIDGIKQQNPYYGMNEQSDREKAMHNILENQITQIISDITLYNNPAAMYDNVSRTAVVGIFDDIAKLNTAFVKWQDGLDRIQTGPNAGESRLANAAMGTVMPGLFQDPTTLGFGKMMETEYLKGEYFDSFFYSDYKQDKRVEKSNKAIDKEKLITLFKEQLNYNQATPEARVELDSYIDKEVKNIIKNNNQGAVNRLNYTMEQQEIDLP